MGVDLGDVPKTPVRVPDSKRQGWIARVAPKKSDAGVIIAFSLFLIVASLAYLADRLPTVIDSLDASKWSQTDGKVISSELTQHIRGGYRPSIEYAYFVSGTEYKSSRVYALSSANEMEYYVREIVNAYPPGSTVTVFYKASDPAYSILRKDSVDNYAGLATNVLVPLLIFAAGIGGIIWCFV